MAPQRLMSVISRITERRVKAQSDKLFCGSTNYWQPHYSRWACRDLRSVALAPAADRQRSQLRRLPRVPLGVGVAVRGGDGQLRGRRRTATGIKDLTERVEEA